MTPHIRKSFLFLCATALLLAASALKAGDLDDPRYAADLRLNNSSDFLSEGPTWFRNALANPRVNYFRSSSLYDRAGDRTESIYRYSNEVGTLANPFNVMLLSSGSAFAYGDGVKTSGRYSPDATLATDYTHTGTTSALWSVTTDWSPTAPAGGPNGAGDIVRYQGAASINTTNSAGAVTTGNIILQGANNNSWTITPTAAITLNQDGAGAGTATLSNTNTNTGSTNALILSTGTWTLADDLLISNTGGSTNTTGAVQIIGTLGGTGNLTFSNINTAISQTGSLRLQTGVNTFVGSVLIKAGTVSFNNAASFGNAANVITLGQSGQGSAALIETTSLTEAHNIIVASGSGGTLTLGSVSTANVANAFSGTITLNGDVSLTSASTVGSNNLTFTSVISGTGGVTKVGAGSLQLSGSNTFSGDTILAAGNGQLVLNNTNALQNSTLNYTGSLFVFSSGVATHAFTLGGLTGSANIALQDNAGTPNAVALSVGNNNANTSYSGILSGGGSLTKIGAGTLTLTNGNTYTGTTSVNGGTLLVNGSTSATSAVSVNGTGSVLGGTGTVSGSVTLGNTSAGATLNPGPSGANGTAASVGTLTVGSLTLSATNASTIHIDAFGTATNEWDKLISNGAIVLNMISTLDVTIASGLTFTPGSTYTLLSGTSLSGTFAGITDGQSVTFSGYTFTADYTATGFDLLVPVPEPSTWIGAALALGVVGWTQRKRLRGLIVRKA